MSSRPAIEVEHVSKLFLAYARKDDRIRELLTRKKLHRAVQALDDVSFVVERGSCIGLVGGNGAGKTTLLQLLAGVMAPTSGTLRIQGNASAILGLGGVFNTAFTGRENAEMAGLAHGLSGAELSGFVERALEFSQLGDAVHRPVRTYSSGMAARLSYSVAFRPNLDVLILDEVLSVGDARFRAKCGEHIQTVVSRGTTLVLATHDLPAIEALCPTVLYLASGRLAELGPAAQVLARYRRDMAR